MKHVTQICKAIIITSKILRNITNIIQHHWWDRKELWHSILMLCTSHSH